MPISKDKTWLKGRNKFLSGFCNDNGKPAQCEGTRPKSGGKPLPTCTHFGSCPCECHHTLDKMYEAIGEERVEAVLNSEYVPQRVDFVMPEVPVPHYAEPSFNSDGGIPAPLLEEPGDAPSRAVQPPSLSPTPSGRRHRGQLEFEVLATINRFLGSDVTITPKLVAETIANEQNIPTPSTGAIQAVWDRWEKKLGICTQAKKPARFVEWMGDFDGTAETLVRIKASKKRQEKSAKSAAARGFR